MCLQHKGSAVSINLAYPPFLCLIYSYLLCHSTLYTTQIFKNDSGPQRAIYAI